DVGSAHGHTAAQPNHRVLAFPLAAHLLVGLGDVDHVLHAGEAFEPRGVHPSVVADEADGGALRARHGPRLVAQLFDHGDDAPDLCFGRAVSHHDQHCYAPPPPMMNRSPSRAAVTGPPKCAGAVRAGSEFSTGGSKW